MPLGQLAQGQPAALHQAAFDAFANAAAVLLRLLLGAILLTALPGSVQSPWRLTSLQGVTWECTCAEQRRVLAYRYCAASCRAPSPSVTFSS